MTILRTIPLLIALINNGVTEIVTKPKDTEVVVGKSVYLNCSSSVPGEIQWFFYGGGGDQERSIVYGYDQVYSPFKGRFRMEKDDTAAAYNLVIDSVLATDAGKYECQDNIGQGAKSSAQIIVIDYDPVCQSNIDTSKVVGDNGCGIEPNILILSCSVNFHGNDAPIMQWTKVGNTSPAGAVTHEIIGNRVVYNLSMNGDSIANNSYYQCNTTRSLATQSGCKSSKVKITGNSCATCPPVSTCDGYIVAIIILILILVAIGVATVSAWYYLCKRPTLRKRLSERIFGSEKADEEKNRKKTMSSDEKEDLIHGTGEGNGEIIQYTKKIKDLETTMDKMEAERNTYKHKIKELEETMDKMKAETMQYIATVASLECHLYPHDTIDYVDNPKLVQPIERKAKQTTKEGEKERIYESAINGIAVLDKELFVAIDSSAALEVYDSETFKFVRSFSVENMQNPQDIASTKVNKILYVISRAADAAIYKICKIKANGEVLKSWPARGPFGRLSTYQSNVIVCLSEEQTICEYSEDGDIIMTVRLSPGAGVNHPWHAIKVTNIHFVVSHGDTDDKLHRVCVVDKEGKIIKDCEKWEKPRKNLLAGLLRHPEPKVPICLLEGRDRRILVADRDRKRIILLSSVLGYERKLIEDDDGLKDVPSRLCFDEAENRLFVVTNRRDSSGKWENGRILVFNMKN